MSANELEAFVLTVRDDETLKAKLKTVNSPANVVAVAAEAGFNFTAQILEDTLLTLPKEDLARVAVRRAGFRLHPYGSRHWFGWK